VCADVSAQVPFDLGLVGTGGAEIVRLFAALELAVVVERGLAQVPLVAARASEGGGDG
jgi:hypothetical protein